MKAIDEMLRAERDAKSPCKVTITLLASGQFSARMSFGPGMETVTEVAPSVEGALAALNQTLDRAQSMSRSAWMCLRVSTKPEIAQVEKTEEQA